MPHIDKFCTHFQKQSGFHIGNIKPRSFKQPDWIMDTPTTHFFSFQNFSSSFVDKYTAYYAMLKSDTGTADKNRS